MILSPLWTIFGLFWGFSRLNCTEKMIIKNSKKIKKDMNTGISNLKMFHCEYEKYIKITKKHQIFLWVGGIGLITDFYLVYKQSDSLE